MKEKQIILLLFVWNFLSESSMGRFVVEKNSLRITSPSSLRDVYECAIGNFGMPQYGGAMVGVVVYPKTNEKGCKKFEDSFKYRAGELPTFLLVDRGDCYFILKAWNAQKSGAAAILVADDRIEPLITMDTPDEGNTKADYLQNISIPSALISKSLGDNMKKALSNGEMVTINLDWRESLPHPDDRVEYELWTNSNDECGPKCDSQINFLNNFKGAAQILERKGYTQFTPHYITWYCPEAFIMSKQCKSQCINHGRYCAPDPEQDFTRGYDGKDVVLQNLYQACFFKVANESGKPWLWWDYVTDFFIRCPMIKNKYTKECAIEVIRSLGVDLKKIDLCVGDHEADTVNFVLKAEQDAQVGKGPRGDVTILPTLIINNRQYRGLEFYSFNILNKFLNFDGQFSSFTLPPLLGKLDKVAVLKAICSGFREKTEPAICLSEDIESNECRDNNGGCWEDKTANITACRDTYRGRVCECPTVQGVKFIGDGYNYCEGSGALRCGINNGGCWKGTRNGRTYSACHDAHSKGCKCPPGFRGDGVKNCEDIDECKEKLACQCRECKCKNTWGSFDCTCNDDLLYMQEHDTCISKIVQTGVSWGFVWLILLGLTIAGLGGFVVYKYRIRSYMDSEIRAIMAQYMPLDNQAEMDHRASQANP